MNGTPTATKAQKRKAIKRNADSCIENMADPAIKPNAQTERYVAFVAADNAFQTELARVYGREAGDMRYQSKLFTDERLKAAYDRFSTAGDAWRQGM